MRTSLLPFLLASTLFDRFQLLTILGGWSLVLSYLHCHVSDFLTWIGLRSNQSKILMYCEGLSVFTSTSLFLFMHLLSHLAWKWPLATGRDGEETGSEPLCSAPRVAGLHLLALLWQQLWVTLVSLLCPMEGGMLCLVRKCNTQADLHSFPGPFWGSARKIEEYFTLVHGSKSWMEHRLILANIFLRKICYFRIPYAYDSGDVWPSSHTMRMIWFEV